MAFTTAASLASLNSGVRSSVEDIVAHTDNVGHNSVSEGPNSGTERSNSVTEGQNSGTKEPKFKWKSDEAKSEWIRKLELGLDSPACYDVEDRVLVMKLPDFKRKPVQHYTPQQWQFGLHNRDLQASTTVASTTESEGLKISLAAACNLKSDRWDKDRDNRWDEFCDNVVDDPELIVLRSYGLHPSVATNFSRKEVQSLLTLDALTLLLVLSSSALPNSYSETLMNMFMLWFEKGGLNIRALLKEGVAYTALRNDLFLFENQIPMNLLKKVISKSYLLLKGENSYSDYFQELMDPYSDLRREFLHKILKNIVCKMCIQIFKKPCADIKQFPDLFDVNYRVGDFDECAHIFACVYEVLTTFDSKKESSTATESIPDEDKTKKSASDREQLPHGTCFGICPTALNIRESLDEDVIIPVQERMECIEKGPGLGVLGEENLGEETLDEDNILPMTRMECLEKGPVLRVRGEENLGEETLDEDKILQLTRKECLEKGPVLRVLGEENLGEEPLRSATDLKKAGLRIKGTLGMIREVAFENGCLILPIVRLNDRTESYFRNLAMYEVFDHYGERRHAFSDYLNLMLHLIRTPEDVAYLINDCEVIRNELITDHNAFEMWDRLQSGLSLPPYSKTFRKEIVDPVNLQCGSALNKMRTEFYDTFCSKPWLAISVITAAVLLLATLIQTYVSVIGSDKMQPHFPRGG
ncbi:hypothetical protein CY35_08G140000 [Sphagnum magellanicum]|nr:hypothetical protein CY35_08G140000 [Sphagnum magellanicum]